MGAQRVMNTLLEERRNILLLRVHLMAAQQHNMMLVARHHEQHHHQHVLLQPTTQLQRLPEEPQFKLQMQPKKKKSKRVGSGYNAKHAKCMATASKSRRVAEL